MSGAGGGPPRELGASFREGLRERARRLGTRLVFPEGIDPRVQAAAAEIVAEGLLSPVLLGPVEEVRAGLEAAGAGPSGVRVLDPRDPARLDGLAPELQARRAHRGMALEEAWERAAQPLFHGALMVRRGEAQGSVAGAAHASGEVVRAALWCVGPAEGIRTVSSSFYMIVPDFRGRGEEVLTFTDAGVVPNPTPPQLADIAVAASTARRAVVGDEPCVAFLSYSTKGSAAGPAIDGIREAMELFRLRMPEVPADGEFQADAALIETVGRFKAPGSPVAGRANVLVFPDLDAGNIAYKLVQRLAGAAAVGPIVQGLARPCNDLSRGAVAADVVDVACVTALMAAS